MDPKKLEAFASKGGPPPGKNGGGNPFGKGGGGSPDDKDEHKDEGGDHEDGGDPTAKYGDLCQALAEFSDDVEASIDELDHEDLTDPEKPMSDEDTQILKEGLDTLDKKLVSALHEAGEKGITTEDAHAIAQKMEEQGHIQDAGLLAGWLYRAAEVAKTMEAPSSGQLPPDESSGELPPDDDEPGDE